MAKKGITAEKQSPFTDSNGFAVTQATAQKLGNITALSQLKDKAPTLRVSGPPECQQRTDCLLGLEKTYGLKFKKFVSIDIAKRHEVIKNGQTDVGEVFTTDGQIKADNLVLLKDDKQLFPPYNADAAGQDVGRRRGRAGLHQDGGPGHGGPDAPGHAGAQLPRGPGQGDAGQGGVRVPARGGLPPVASR